MGSYDIACVYELPLAEVRLGVNEGKLWVLLWVLLLLFVLEGHTRGIKAFAFRADVNLLLLLSRRIRTEVAGNQRLSLGDPITCVPCSCMQSSLAKLRW